MYQQTSSPRASKGLVFWLIVLGIVTVLVVLLALRKFNKDSGDMSQDTAPTSPTGRQANGETPPPTGNPGALGTPTESVLVGRVTSIISSKEGTEGKWVGVTPIAQLLPPGQKVSPDQPKIAEYKFFFSATDTEGMKDSPDLTKIDQVAVHYMGALSEKDYVPAQRIEVFMMPKAPTEGAKTK